MDRIGSRRYAVAPGSVPVSGFVAKRGFADVSRRERDGVTGDSMSAPPGELRTDN
jgi:hypothetical protein